MTRDIFYGTMENDFIIYLQGRLMDKADAYFSSFRRCNYPRLMSDGTVALVHECGRYAK